MKKENIGRVLPNIVKNKLREKELKMICIQGGRIFYLNQKLLRFLIQLKTIKKKIIESKFFINKMCLYNLMKIINMNETF